MPSKPEIDDPAAAERLIGEVWRAHLHPDPAVRAARLAEIERRKAAERAEFERRRAELQAEAALAGLELLRHARPAD